MNVNNNCNGKVLFAVDSLKQRSGVTAVVMNYFRNINRKDVEIDFIAYEDSEKEIIDEIESRGGTVYFMPKLSVLKAKEFINWVDNFFETHREYRIIHSHFTQIDSLLFRIAKKYGNRCCISHSHNTKYAEYPLRAIRNSVLCFPIKREADVWAACGEKAGEFLYGKSFMKSPKHLVINNAVDISKFYFKPEIRKKVRKELCFSDEFVVGNVGSLKPQKNQMFLLDVFAELINRFGNKINAILIIVGDGELRTELEEKADKLGINDKVRFLGTRKDVPDLMQAMDVFVLPSLYEGLPVAGVEAQAVGLPCVFSGSITHEVDICNSVYINLDKSCSEWAEKISSFKSFERKDCHEKIVQRGYSIKDEAEKLTGFYKQKLAELE